MERETGDQDLSPLNAEISSTISSLFDVFSILHKICLIVVLMRQHSLLIDSGNFDNPYALWLPKFPSYIVNNLTFFNGIIIE